MRDGRKNAYEAQMYYRDVQALNFGIHTSLTAGIPSNRIVYLNTEAKDVVETVTDSPTCGYAATTGATTYVLGVVKDGWTEYEDGTVFMPGINRDPNVTVVTLGMYFVEVAPGATIAVGENLGADTVGRATAGGSTGIIAMTAATGVDTATNPEYVVCYIK